MQQRRRPDCEQKAATAEAEADVAAQLSLLPPVKPVSSASSNVSNSISNSSSSSSKVLSKETRPSDANKPERSRPRPSGLWVDTRAMNNSAPSSTVGSPTSAKIVPRAAPPSQSSPSLAPAPRGGVFRSLSLSAAPVSLNASAPAASPPSSSEKALEGEADALVASAEPYGAPASGTSVRAQELLDKLKCEGNLQGTYGKVLLVKRSEVRKIPGAEHLARDSSAASDLFVVKSAPLSQLSQAQHGRNELAVLQRRLHEESENIVKLEFAREWGDCALMVLECCEQGDLHSVWGCDPLRTCEHLVILADVARGLECLHRHNIIHGDLKPENIGMTSQGTAKLLDFGLSTTLDPSRHFNRSNGRLECVTQSGTLAYASPEIFKRRPHGTESDWWSFAVLAFEALFAAWPWQHEDPNIMCDLICQTPVEVPDFLDTKDLVRTPMSLRTFFAASFRKNPTRRLGYEHGFREIQASRFWTELAPWWTWDPNTHYGSISVDNWEA